MRRTKTWWAALEPGERIRLVYLEANDKSYRSDYIPDDCSECGACGTPHTSYGLCPYCLDDHQRIVTKADAAERRQYALVA